MDEQEIQYRRLLARDYNKSTRLISMTFDKSELPNFRKAWKKKELAFSLIAQCNNIPIGLALVSKDNCIQYITIDPDYQELGIGSQLLRKVCEEMSDQPSIWLKTAESPWLRGWYEKYGFVHEKTYLSKDGGYLGDCMIKRQRRTFRKSAQKPTGLYKT